MTITIESTSQVVEFDTGNGRVSARIWEGTTDAGVPVHCFITRIAVAGDADPATLAAFRRDLEQQRPPSPALEGMYPLRMIL